VIKTLSVNSDGILLGTHNNLIIKNNCQHLGYYFHLCSSDRGTAVYTDTLVFNSYISTDSHSSW